MTQNESSEKVPKQYKDEPAPVRKQEASKEFSQPNEKQKNGPIKELQPRAKENNVKNPLEPTEKEIKPIKEKIGGLSNNRKYSDKNGKLNSKGINQQTLKKIDIESKNILSKNEFTQQFKHNKNKKLQNKITDQAEQIRMNVNNNTTSKGNQVNDIATKAREKLTKAAKNSDPNPTLKNNNQQNYQQNKGSGGPNL